MCVNLQPKIRILAMKRSFQTLCLLFAAMLTMTACLGSNDDEDTTVYYDDVVATSFSLGTLNRYLHTTTSAGADSVYKSTFAGSVYPMTIDHLNGEIYNRDSLPYGTDLVHVVCSLATRNNGMAYFKSLVSDTLWIYDVSDSIDLSQPRQLHIFSSDGQHRRIYDVRLNVKQTSVDGQKWVEEPSGDFPGNDVAPVPQDWTSALIDGDESRLPVTSVTSALWTYEYARNSTCRVALGNDASGHVVVWRQIASATDADARWVFMTSSDTDTQMLPEGVTYSLVYYDESLLAFSSHGLTYYSPDKGLTWRENSLYAQPDGVSGEVWAFADGASGLWLKSLETGRVWRWKAD